ncbi:MAG: DUF1439 domain-containing protein, partial [Microvirga sp.]
GGVAEVTLDPTRCANRMSRRGLLRLIGGAAALQLPSVALAGFNFFLSEYSASHAELQAQLTKRFPLRQRYAELFAVTLRDPQLELDPANNRLRVTARLDVASPLLRPPTVEGLVSVSSALRYDAPARSVRLDQPRADRIEIEGLTGRVAERLQQIGALVAQELLQGQALHTFDAKDLTVGNKVYEIGDITVQRDGMTVQLK